jgi:hypothetical protein
MRLVALPLGEQWSRCALLARAPAEEGDDGMPLCTPTYSGARGAPRIAASYTRADPLVKRDAHCPFLCAHGRPGCGADARCAAQVPVSKYKYFYFKISCHLIHFYENIKTNSSFKLYLILGIMK